MNHMITNLIIWRDIESDPPEPFVSVLGCMTDAGEFPAVREGYSIGIPSGELYFPALQEFHPVSLWAEMPEPKLKQDQMPDYSVTYRACKLCGKHFYDLNKSGYCNLCEPYEFALKRLKKK